MSDAVNKQPSFEEQVERFKGFTTVDGEVRPEKEAERGVVGEKTAEKVEKPANRSAQDVLAGRNGARAADPDEPDAETDEGDEPAPKAGEKAPDQRQDARKPPTADAQKRINQAVGRQRAAERERDQAIQLGRELAQRMEALERRLSGGSDLTREPQQRQNDGAPDPSNYQYGDSDSRYIADLARYETRQTFRAEQAKVAQDQQAHQRQQSAAAHEQALADFGVKGSAKYEDFQEVVLDSANAGEWPLSPVVGELVLTSDHGEDIAYFLATHHDEARRIANLPPAKQAAWFGQQEALLSSQLPDAGTREVPKATKAPPLPSARARGGGSKASVSADTTDFAAFEAMARGGSN